MTRFLPLLALLALLWLAPTRDAQAACQTLVAPSATGVGDYKCATISEAYSHINGRPMPSYYNVTGCKATKRPVVYDASAQTFGYVAFIPAGQCGFGQDTTYVLGTSTWTTGCPNGGIWSELSKTCKPPCDQRAAGSSGAVAPGLPYTVCSDGCELSGTPDPASPRLHIETPTGAQCNANDYTCPAGMEKGTGNSGAGSSTICVPKPEQCPAGQSLVNGVCKPKPDECAAGKHMNDQAECEPDKSQCPAGKTKAPDGSCVDDPEKNKCPTGQVKGTDGTCKKDANGDGKPDADDGTFGDSTDCARPPQCSGDKIMCGQVLIQWRIECNTRKRAEVSGGICAAPPVCTGDGCGAVEVATLRQQWKTACELEKLNKGGQGGDAGQPEWTKVGGMSTNPSGVLGAGDADGAKVRDSDVDPSDIEETAWIGGGGSCPSLALTGGGSKISDGFIAALANPDPPFCTLIGVISTILVMLAAVGSIIYMVKGGA